jgi:hypothetical protein
LGTRAPRLLQSWDECAGLTASTHLPAHAALHAKIVKIVRNWLRPVSWMDISDRRAEDLYLKRRLKQLKRLHRAVSRKQKGSKNRTKATRKLAKQYRKVANQRANTLQQVTHGWRKPGQSPSTKTATDPACSRTIIWRRPSAMWASGSPAGN